MSIRVLQARSRNPSHGVARGANKIVNVVPWELLQPVPREVPQEIAAVQLLHAIKKCHCVFGHCGLSVPNQGQQPGSNKETQ